MYYKDFIALENMYYKDFIKNRVIKKKKKE